MKRLTSRQTAQQIADNFYSLRDRGFETSVSHELYLKLAFYENLEEDGKIPPFVRYEEERDAKSD